MIESSIGTAGPVERLQLIQERMNLQNELATMGNAVDLAGLEADFVEAAKGYGDRKGISYAAWRELGVAPDVLRRAGLTRGRA